MRISLIQSISFIVLILFLSSPLIAQCSNPEKWSSDVRVTADPSYSFDPSLTWTGSEYGVCWDDYRDGNWEIYFARLDSQGNKIGSDVRVTNASSNSVYPVLVWTGSGYGVSWDDYRDGNWEIYFALLDSQGNKIGSDVRITSDYANSIGTSLIWTGQEYGVSWSDDRDGNWDIYFARISSSGSKVGSDSRVTNDTATSYYSRIVWTGSEYGIVWENDQEGNYEIYFAQYDSSGNKIGSEARITFDPSDVDAPSFIWTGNEYGLSWHDNRSGNLEIYFTRLDSSGIKIGSDIRITHDSSESKSASLVWTGSEYGLSWRNSLIEDIYSQIYFARFDPSGGTMSLEKFTSGSSDSSQPFLVWGGNQYGLSWYDNRNGNYEIYFGQLRCCTPDLDNDGDSWCWRDCNDNDVSIYPGAPEYCDGIDTDCDGVLDNICTNFDVNNDSLINGTELAWLGRAFGLSNANPENEWWYTIDYNHDDIVDGNDLAILTSQGVWGKTTVNCSFACP